MGRTGVLDAPLSEGGEKASVRAVMVAVEGVLAEDRSANLYECPPAPAGILFHASIKHQYEVVVVSATFPKSAMETWLDKEAITPVMGIFTPIDNQVAKWLEGKELHTELLRQARTNGHDIQLYVTADPVAAHAAYLAGVQTLLSVSPTYGRAEWRPDFVGQPRPWDELVEEIDHARSLHHGDERRTVRE